MLHMTKRVTFVIALAAILLAAPQPLHAAQQPRPQPQAQTEFVPLDQLPAQEQMPAAPLVIVAYSTVWLAIFIYLASIWRRLQKVDRELADVARRVTERSRT